MNDLHHGRRAGVFFCHSRSPLLREPCAFEGVCRCGMVDTDLPPSLPAPDDSSLDPRGRLGSA